MKKFVFYLNLLLIVLVQVADVWYLTNGGLWRKGVTSFGFVLIGILNLAYLIAVRKKPLRFPVLLTIGLAVAMLGDIVVNVRFIEGALIFAVGTSSILSRTAVTGSCGKPTGSSRSVFSPHPR